LKVWVSVTTTKARFGLLFYSLQSLKRQDFADFSIIVNLSEDSYMSAGDIDVVPEWMRGGNVDVCWVDNCRSYQKLLPQILKIGEDDILVTADDDVLYSQTWLSRLVARAVENPDAIVCCRARKIKRNLLGRFQNYSQWGLCMAIERGMDLLPTGCGGAVYRKSLLDLEFLSHKAYRKYAPTADDLWFRLASIRNGVEVYVDPAIDEESGYIQHSGGLQEGNIYWAKAHHRLYGRILMRIGDKVKNYLGVPLCENDVAWRRSWEYSGLSMNKLFK
jgi:hypothetical protein